MENIGLITFSTTLDNYGQVLQALATKDYLQERGHRVFLMREKEDCLLDMFSLSIRMFVKRFIYFFTRSNSIKQSIKAQENYVHWKSVYKYNEKIHPRFFEQFRTSNFEIINCCDGAIKQYRITALCAGSDQIWGGPDKYHFLQIGPNSLKRFSIAPSTGDKQLTKEGGVLVAQWLRGFSFVTVREPSGVQMCKSCGYNRAHLILDPTFLLSSNQYNSYAPSQCSDDNYIFVYLLRAQAPISLESIEEFAKKNNLAVKYVPGQGRMDEHDKIYATIPEWLSLIRDARYVITNSFHGMAFSIIFRKSFLVLPRVDETKNMNERITSLSKELGLTDRIYKDDLETILKPIDYHQAEQKIESNKKNLDDLMRENL